MFREAKQQNKKLVFGLIHLRPMPGTPFYKDGDLEESIKKAIHDAKALENGGASGCLIQTVDKIYPSGDDTDYVRVAGMAVVANEVKKAVGRDFKVGVQIMWNCITPSLAVAKSVGADFTRCTALVGSVQSPYGLVEANPLKVFEYRRKIEAEGVELLAEVSGYHRPDFRDGYDRDLLLGYVRSAVNFGARAVEIMHKDEELNNQMVMDIHKAFPHVPVILGGGTDLTNVSSRLALADGALVGSCFEDGNWGGMINEATVAAYMEQVRKLEVQ